MIRKRIVGAIGAVLLCLSVTAWAVVQNGAFVNAMYGSAYVWSQASDNDKWQAGSTNVLFASSDIANLRPTEKPVFSTVNGIAQMQENVSGVYHKATDPVGVYIQVTGTITLSNKAASIVLAGGGAFLANLMDVPKTSGSVLFKTQ